MRVGNEEIPVELVREERRESADNIHIIRLLDPDFSKHFIDQMWSEQDLWIPAPTHYTLEDEGTIDKDLWDAMIVLEPSHGCRFIEVRKQIAEGLAAWLDPTQERYLLLGMLALARYGIGGHLRVHSDSLPHINRWRRWSLVLYLNDDFEGGATSFPLLGKEFKAGAGQALLFPSHYVHRAEPVKAGHKYVLVFFLGDPSTAPPGF